MGQRQPMPLPPRMDSMQSGPGPNRGPPGPPRPSTGQGHRPPPQRFYPDSQGPPQPQGGYAGPQYGNGPQGPPQSMRQQSRGSYDDIFDSYGGSARFSNPDHNAVPNFDNIPQQVPRGSVDLHLNSGPSLANSGNRTKSQPDLRSQNQIFEMAGDAPPMPSLPPGGQFGGGRGAPGQPMPMRGPGAPGLPGHPGPRGPTGPMAPKPLAPQASNNPDALPSHPTPVRPGLMADSVVNVSSNSMPARAYGNQTPTPMMQGGVGPRPNSAPSRPPQEPVTAQELDRLRAIFKADANDHETGLKLAKMLVEASDVLTPNIPDPRAKSRAREKYLADAHKVLKKLSHGSNKDAMFFFADCIGRGLFSSEPDHKEAFTLYQSAAKLGHAAAAYRTAVCCEIGHEDGGGTRKDPLKAIQWYKRSATLGDTPAMYKMGMIQLKGLLGQPRNPREAIGWLKRAADQSDAENPHALHELGLLYESAGGDDVIIRDEKYAFSLFKKAAELGYKFSQFRMGCAYEYGLMGCPIDPRLSIMWYSKAAVQQEHQAELALSGWYLTGSEGVLAQSDSEAYLWARKAATAGLAKAEYAMGYFTEVGIGTAANMDDAKRWYWRAAAQDLLKARERLEDLKRTGKSGPRQRERISRSKQQEGECSVM
ncbi:related to protoplast regeneration and killer toxin resistance protein [Cephalotrichum gorgonifer]|uniref:Related to protoplast regeneration and killer toxin resistance protein n=1 Tax=Cephalotrichum gorgonifer TaxID=2041049 RepID=A0AAE8STU9_9PEZI|nr:related to protoplast regeneration and killer toxin resistance protein [Cephalotrichum gorgonifer]